LTVPFGTAESADLDGGDGSGGSPEKWMRTVPQDFHHSVFLK
jgi:hypothetical protein